MNIITEAANILFCPIRECCPPKTFTLHNLPFEQQAAEPFVGESHVHFRLPHHNQFQQNAITAFENSLDLQNETDRLKKRLFSELEMIEINELIHGVALCCQKVNELVNKKYALGLAINKSQTFVAELALPYLKCPPNETFSVATDKGSYQTKLIPYITDYVVFDDASYSGHQLRELITRFSIESNEYTFRHHRLLLVVPFISSLTLAMFRQLQRDLEGLEIHLITTTKRIKAIRDKFSDEEMRLLEIWLKSIYRPQNLCLTFTEWKTPDAASVPEKMAGFVTSYREVYKKNQ